MTRQPVADATGTGDSPPNSVPMVLIASAVVVAALYYGQELLVPLVLAALLAFVLAPLTKLLQRAFLPRVAAVLLAVALAFVAIGLLGLVVGRQIGDLATSLPNYEATVMEKWRHLISGSFVLQHIFGNQGAASGKPGGVADALDLKDANFLALAQRFAQPLLSPLADAGVVLVFTLFALLYSEDLRDRFVRLVGRQDLHRTIFALNEAGKRLSRFFLFQLAVNACYGLWTGIWLLVLGIPGAILWGILAMLMRFVPFIGTPIAMVPPLAVAIATAPNWTPALLVMILYVGSESITGQVIEPQIYGHSTGLSPVAVIVATAFWALLWGAVGLLLATPLTVCLVVIGRHVKPLAFFDVIFGDTSPLMPAETFYLRALEMRSAVLARSARQQIALSSLSEYYDRVALTGLAMAQRDRARDGLAFERLEAIHDQIEALLAALAPGAAESDPADARVPDAWRSDGAILCIPGRGQLDDLAATMAGQVLSQAGFGVRSETNLVLDGPSEADPGLAGVRLCCLSVLEAGASASSIRYFVRRMEKKMPGAFVVVGLWQAAGDSAVLATLRTEGGAEHLVLSIGELLAFARAISNRREPALSAGDAPQAAAD